MAFEQRNQSGALFKNDKRGNAKAPDYTGDATIEGRSYRMSAWLKDGKKGKFMSVAFTPKEAKSPAGQYEAERSQDARQAEAIDQKPRTARKSSAEMNDDIPW